MRTIAPPTALLLEAAEPIEQIARYGAMRLDKNPGAAVNLRELHADYQTWCQGQGLTPVPLAEFTACLQEIADEVGDIEVKRVGRRTVLANMQLRERRAAA